MSEAESRLHYPFADSLPEQGCALTVAPGAEWVRMGLPFALDHINLWLVRDTVAGLEGRTVADCFVNRPIARAQWEDIFENALKRLPILRVFATHLYADHVGLAHWLCKLWNAAFVSR